jgi:hypothetical protein
MTSRSVLLSIALLLASGVARAQDMTETRAAGLFRAGSAAYEHGDYQAAARAFEEANRVAPAAAAEYNAGLAWEAAGQKLDAAADYQRALSAGGLAKEQGRDARRRLKALDAALGHLHVVAPDGSLVAVDHAQPSSPPLDLRVLPGPHVVTMQLGERTDHRDLQVTAGKVTDVSFESAPPPVAAPSPPPEAPAPAAAAPPETSPETGSAAPGKAQRTWGWIAIGGGAVLAGTAVFLGERALSERDTFDKSGDTDAGAHDAAANLRLWTNVAWVGAALAAGTGIVLLTTAPSRRPAPEARLLIGPGSLQVDGRF